MPALSTASRDASHRRDSRSQEASAKHDAQLVSRQQWTAHSVLVIMFGVVLAGLQLRMPGTLEHAKNVLFIPGLLPTLLLSMIAPLLTHKVVKATKDAFLQKGFGGRDLLKGSSQRIPESLGLPTSIVYCMLMCCFIPFRYGMRSEAEARVLNADGGWNGNMHGQSGFPHHEVCRHIADVMVRY